MSLRKIEMVLKPIKNAPAINFMGALTASHKLHTEFID